MSKIYILGGESLKGEGGEDTRFSSQDLIVQLDL